MSKSERILTVVASIITISNLFWGSPTVTGEGVLLDLTPISPTTRIVLLVILESGLAYSFGLLFGLSSTIRLSKLEPIILYILIGMLSAAISLINVIYLLTGPEELIIFKKVFIFFIFSLICVLTILALRKHISNFIKDKKSENIEKRLGVDLSNTDTIEGVPWRYTFTAQNYASLIQAICFFLVYLTIYL